MSDMKKEWTEMAQWWLDEHPVMNPPKGFALDPEQVGPSWDNEADPRPTWRMYSSEGECEYLFLDAADDFVREHAANPKVVRIEKWEGSDCVWAAKRAAS